MTAPTTLIPAYLAQDLASTLTRLRLARAVGDESEIKINERRLNWLIDTKLPRP